MSGYCATCNNTGEVDCYCGGDLCVCENGGVEPCPDCDGGFYCDEVDDYGEGFDAGEWNNPPQSKP